MNTGEMQRLLAMFGNEMVMANKRATLETWPELRKATTERFNLGSAFDMIEYDPSLTM